MPAREASTTGPTKAWARPEPKLDPAFQRALKKLYAVDGDVPCPRCRYNLRGLEGFRCPECGSNVRELVIHLATRGAPPPFVTRPFIVGYIAMIAALPLAVVAPFLLAPGSSATRPGFISVGGALAVLVWWILWIAARSWIVQRSSAVAWGIALVCCAVPAALAIACLTFA